MLQLSREYTGPEASKPLDANFLKTMADPNHRYNMGTRSVGQEEREAMRELAKNTYKPAQAPAWLKHDRQVLRFYAYFQEAVTEDAKENYRIRQCTICLFLEDGTMMVTEPKVMNSGIPQGAFVKRHRVPRPAEMGGGYYTFEDFRLGETLTIYSRAFRILDCDDFTREFYAEALGAPLGQEEDAPQDTFAVTMKNKSKENGGFDRDMVDNLEYRHLALGGNRKNGKLEQYLENDRKVLAFQCYWDDHTLYGARMYFTLHYFLSDDSVEILDNHIRNSGRDTYPVFWRRSKLVANPHTSAAPGMLEPDAVIYRPEDLIVGQSITVYNRQLHIFDCDDFTRSFYQTYLDIVQPKIVIETPGPIHAALNPPPHNGVGQEEDSLANCLHLVPKAAKKDINKLMAEDGKTIRFEAVMTNGRAEDENRKFVVVYYIADGTVGTYEMQVRNSGHSGKKFAVKGRKRNPATGNWFQPQDFFIGATLDIHSAPLCLIKADEGSMKYMEKFCDDFPFADVDQILAKLSPLKGDIAQADSVMPDDLQQLAYQRLGLELVEHELVTLARALGEVEPPGLMYTQRILERIP